MNTQFSGYRLSVPFFQRTNTFQKQPHFEIFYTNNPLSVQKNNCKHETKITCILPSRYNHYSHSEVYFCRHFSCCNKLCMHSKGMGEVEGKGCFEHLLQFICLGEGCAIRLLWRFTLKTIQKWKEKPCSVLWGRLFQCPQSGWFAPFGEKLASLATNKRK